MIESDIITKAEALNPWYHEIKLTPDYTTKSNMLGSAEQWRAVERLIGGIDYVGKTTLDIGTMDGCWAFEAEDRGASLVVAADIFQRNPVAVERLLFARSVRDSRIIPLLNGDINMIADRLDSIAENYPAIREGFDVVQCFGLLYHVQNPMLALHQLRRIVKEGTGLVLIETAVLASECDTPIMQLNSDLSLYNDASTFWVPNMPCLDAMLKLAGLERFGDLGKVHQPFGYRASFACRPLPVDPTGCGRIGGYFK